jgi:hypothetical protein
MNCITSALTCHIATTAIKCSWSILSAGERVQALGERAEAWAHRLAARWGCVDDVLATITIETLRSR